MGKGPLRQGAPPLMAQAVALLQQGRRQDCEKVLERLIAAAPRDHAALNLAGVVYQEKGDYARAIKLLHKAVELQSSAAPYHGNLGNAYLMSEQFAEAQACYRRVLALEPGSQLARFGLGMAYIGQKDFASAASELETVVKNLPGHVDAHSNLGAALSELGRHKEAVFHFERALALKPGNANIHFKYGVALKQAGELRGACSHLARAVMLDPTLADAAYLTGMVLLALDRLDDAAQALREALKIRPEMIPALYELGQVLNRLQQYEEAADCFERALALDPQSPSLYQGLARTRHLQGRCKEARSFVAKALEHNADEADCCTMLGLIHQSEGDFEAAVTAYRRAVAVKPAHGHARLCLALINKTGDAAADIHELERVNALGTLDSEQRISLQYALAKAYEKVGDHDAAFLQYQAANDQRKAQYPFNAAAATDLFNRLITTFNKDLFGIKAGIGSASERPVFIVGMMRTGTTLTEQILSSHPSVHGHGELDHIRRIVAKLPGALGGSYPECVGALDMATAQRFANDYVAFLERDAPQAARSTDKLPHNFERLGTIALLFPRARIIHCVRDPLDSCLSSYFHDFEADNRFTYDLGTLGTYYRQYRQLMEHWKAILPNPILEVPYEALVADQEGWSRKLVDFLGLPWDDRCLAFHKNSRPVYTYSLWQVRQPIYSSSIERWRPYAKHLGPLFDALEIPRPDR